MIRINIFIGTLRTPDVHVPYTFCKKKGCKKASELLWASDMLPFINIHYLTLYADGNVVIQDYLNMSGICTLDFIAPFRCAAACLHKTHEAPLQNEVDTIFY